MKNLKNEFGIFMKAALHASDPLTRIYRRTVFVFGSILVADGIALAIAFAVSNITVA